MLIFGVKVEKFLYKWIFEDHNGGSEIWEIHRNFTRNATKIEFWAQRTLQNNFLIPGTCSGGPTSPATNLVCLKTSYSFTFFMLKLKKNNFFLMTSITAILSRCAWANDFPIFGDYLAYCLCLSPPSDQGQMKSKIFFGKF